MYELVAVYNDVAQDKIGGPFTDHYRREVVAVFTDGVKGQRYIRLAKLKTRVRESFGSDRVFRDRSLLRGACNAFLRDVDPADHPVDPTL